MANLVPEPDPEPETIRVIGRVKWFDTVKGYGFIVADSAVGGQLDSDVMLHISVLRRHGESYADEDARIVCDAVRRDRGWQAANIIEMDKPRANAAAALVPDGALQTLIVKWYNKAKGYGFVQLPGSEEDIFLHATVLRAGGLDLVDAGDVVTGLVEGGKKGKHVASVKGPVEPGVGI